MYVGDTIIYPPLGRYHPTGHSLCVHHKLK
jgi:hypothetical protein